MSEFSEYNNLLTEIDASNQNLISCFFILFSRMEYALKVSGYLIGNENYVSPDWTKFANTYNEAFQNQLNSKPKLLDATNYYWKNQPYKQVLQDGYVTFKESSYTNRNLDSFLLLLRRVRNNLFHGGKYPFIPVSEPARNIKLLEHGITIMLHCIKLNESIYNHFIIHYEVYKVNSGVCSWEEIVERYDGEWVAVKNITPSKKIPLISHAEVVLVSKSKTALLKEMRKLPLGTIEEVIFAKDYNKDDEYYTIVRH